MSTLRVTLPVGVLLAALFAGCSKDDPTGGDVGGAGQDGEGTEQGGGGPESGGASAGGSGAALGGEASGGSDASASSIYAIMYEVYDDSGSISYLSLLDSLELDEVDLSKAREMGSGRAFVQAYNNWLFVGESEEPKVTRYVLDESGKLVADGEPISFANFGLSYGQFDSWNVTFINPEKAYLLNFDDATTIVWNPSTMEVIGELPPPEELTRPGYSVESTPGALRDGLLFRTFSWVNYDDAEYSTDYFLAAYDVESDEVVSLVKETRCPVPGNLVHQDEAGNIYFSNWIWPVAGVFVRDAPAPCVLRVEPGEMSFSKDWTLEYPDVTDGHQGGMFSYLKGGRALVSAFYDERTSYDETTDPWSLVGSNNWKIWSVDLDTRRGAPLEGLGFNGGAYTPVQFDGRLFLMVPGGEEDNYATQLFEVVDGAAEPRIKLPGWSYQFVKLR